MLTMVHLAETGPGCIPWHYLVFPVMSTLRQLSNHPAMLIPRQLDDADIKIRVQSPLTYPRFVMASPYLCPRYAHGRARSF